MTAADGRLPGDGRPGELFHRPLYASRSVGYPPVMLLLLACVTAGDKESAPGDDSSATADSDSATDTDTVTTLPDEYNGVQPESPVELPEFAARNQLGEGRGPEDLLGQPTVMWFYPAAGTSG